MALCIINAVEVDLLTIDIPFYNFLLKILLPTDKLLNLIFVEAIDAKTEDIFNKIE